METNSLSQLSLRMLEVDSKDPLRKDPINMVKLGMDLQELQKVVNESKSQGQWLKFIDQFFGKDKRPLCYRALSLYRHQIPLEDLIKASSVNTICKNISNGHYRKYINDPRQYWMKTFRVYNETPVTTSLIEPTNSSRNQKLSRQKSKDPNYYNRPNKDVVENYVVNMGRQYFHDKVTSLTIVGKRYQKHVNRLFAAFAKNVYILENNPETLKDIKDKMVHCPYHNYDKRVSVVPMDASEITILNCPFIDLDIEGTFPGTTNTIRKHAASQISSLVESAKIFAFTFASRGGRYSKSEINYDGLKSILECFNIELIGFNGSIGNFGKNLNKSGGTDMPGAVKDSAVSGDANMYCKKHIVNCKPMKKSSISVFDIVYFTYNDGQGPMGHMAIAYK